MSHTNSTTNYGLPQWIGSDKPTFLGDFNSAFNTIDGQMKQNSTDAGQAVNTANAANATAIDAADRSITAKNTADTAKDTADAANALATTASNTATVAKNTAESAARTAQANNIGNLAPAYDPTLTYNVGDLVTYIDENNSGKLYKCIVAWETPGEFNINYWDDVTVSEIIGGEVIAELDVTSDSGLTYNTALEALGALAGVQSLKVSDFYKTIFMKIKQSGEYNIYHPFIANNNYFGYVYPGYAKTHTQSVNTFHLIPRVAGNADAFTVGVRAKVDQTPWSTNSDAEVFGTDQSSLAPTPSTWVIVKTV